VMSTRPDPPSPTTSPSRSRKGRRPYDGVAQN
jgi:hypothetical protein